MSSGLRDMFDQANNAMRAFETALRIHTNNSANISTSGYKALRYDFDTIFNEVLSSGTPANGNLGSTNPIQTGPGVTISNIQSDFKQGELGEAGRMDLAISGRGLFLVSRDGGNTFLYTRNGEFKVDSTGKFIVDSSGRQVYGFPIVGGVPQTGQLVPLKTDGFSSEFMGWRDNGVLVGNFDDGDANTPAAPGAETPLYQIALTDFNNPGGLQLEDGTAFDETVASGAPLNIAVAGTGVYGNISSQKLEKSNVFFIGETIKSIEVQRALSASLSAVKTASDIISSVINKLSG